MHSKYRTLRNLLTSFKHPTMAEALGFVASGAGVVSLAFTLAESIKKLNDFCDAVKDAPEEIRLTIDEIEILSLLLEDIDQTSQQQIYVSPAIRLATIKSFGLCKDAARSLQSLVKDLHDGLSTKKKRSAFKFALKKEKVEELRSRLERAKSTMLLASQCYRDAMDQQRLEALAIEMTQMRAVLSVSTVVSAHKDIKISLTNEEKSLCEVESSTQTITSDDAPSGHQDSYYHQLSRRLRRGKLQSRGTWAGFIDYAVYNGHGSSSTSITFRLPRWLYARRYEFMLRSSYQGFEQRLKSYKVMPYEAPIFQCCMDGDLKGLRKLLQWGLATPFEVDLDGRTPLHVSFIKVYNGSSTHKNVVLRIVFGS